MSLHSQSRVTAARATTFCLAFYRFIKQSTRIELLREGLVLTFKCDTNLFVNTSLVKIEVLAIRSIQLRWTNLCTQGT